MVAPAIVRMVPNDEENLTGSCLDFSIVISFEFSQTLSGDNRIRQQLLLTIEQGGQLKLLTVREAP